MPRMFGILDCDIAISACDLSWLILMNKKSCNFICEARAISRWRILYWPNWNVFFSFIFSYFTCKKKVLYFLLTVWLAKLIEYWLLPLPVPLFNVFVFLIAFHFSAYRKLARSYHPDVNKWVDLPFLLSPFCCAGSSSLPNQQVFVMSDSIVGFWAIKDV